MMKTKEAKKFLHIGDKRSGKMKKAKAIIATEITGTNQ